MNRDRMKYEVEERMNEIYSALRRVSDAFCKIEDNCFLETKTRKKALYALTLSDKELVRQDIFVSAEHFESSVKEYFHLLEAYISLLQANDHSRTIEKMLARHTQSLQSGHKGERR